MKKRLLSGVFGILMIATASFGAAVFSGDGGTFLTLSINGTPTTFQMTYSSQNEPIFNGCNLGVFSRADGDTLVLTGFANKTQEDMGTSVSLGRLAHWSYPEGSPSTVGAVTNISDNWRQVEQYVEVHYATNLSENLLAGLPAGRYKLACFAQADGNFNPIFENNNGSNFVASFTLIDESAARGSNVVFTDNGQVTFGFSCVMDAGYGSDVFVVGNHPALGYWYPVNGVKLHWTDGNVWTGQVALPCGNSYQYKYVIKTNAGASFCDAGNNTWETNANRFASTSLLPEAPSSGKTMLYYSTWTNAFLLFQRDYSSFGQVVENTNWSNVELTRIGAGRTGGEYLYRLDGFSQRGEALTFIPHGFKNGAEEWDHSQVSGGNYYTDLDTFVLQDGYLYNYWPPATYSAGTIETQLVASSYEPAVSSRCIRVYLPRHYSQNTWKKYPVLYMHDGQNVFAPGGIYGCWNAENVADAMIGLGKMRETIIVAIDNTASRSREFIPPMDNEGAGTGFADQYRNFIVNDVKAYIDTNYRTLSDPANTVMIGSSYGGVVSTYIGLTTNVFSKIGPMSPAYGGCTNFVAQRMDAGDTFGLRIYTDMGTGAYDVDEVARYWDVCNMFQIDGYVNNDTLKSVIACGADHNEAAWNARLYVPFCFLLNLRDEPNLIEQELHPPEAAGSVSTNGFSISFRSMKGRQYILQRSQSLLTPVWSNVSTGSVEEMQFRSATLSDNPAGIGAWYYRVKCAAWPN